MCIYGYPAKNANTSKSMTASKESESREICGRAANTLNNKSLSLDSKESEPREISGWAVQLGIIKFYCGH